MQSELFSLSKLFTQNIFRIPDYQRGYSWGKRELRDFWEDIDLLDKDQDHYTGVLTLEHVYRPVYSSWEDDLWIIDGRRYQPYYVVDGQQRLTTAIILLQCLIEKAGERDLNYYSVADIRKKYLFESRDGGISKSHIFGYEKDNPSYEYLKTKILMTTSDNYYAGEVTIYTNNLLNAKRYFAKKLEEISFDKLEEYFTKLTQNFMFNMYTMSETINVFVAFETMNNRGKQLSHLELLKNRLIYLSTKLDIDQFERAKLRKTINDSWKKAYHFLGKNKNQPLDDDDFLYTQFLLYSAKNIFSKKLFTENEETIYSSWHFAHDDDYYQKFILDQYFSTRNLRVEQLDLEKTISDGSVDSKSIDTYARDIDHSIELFFNILNPDQSNQPDNLRISLSRLRRLGWQRGLPLGVAALGTANADLINLTLFERLERYLFILGIRSRSSNDDLDLEALAVKVARGRKSLEDVSEEIHSKSEQIARNMEIKDTLYRWSGQSAYYGWRHAKYFLYEYEQHLKALSRSSRDKLNWSLFAEEKYESDYSTIEHIYPQQANVQYWKEQFGHLEIKQRNAIRNSLGNLLALSRSKNSSLSNRSFPDKRDGQNDCPGYRMGSYSEIEVSHLPDWTPHAALERGIRMLEFMEKRWKLKLGNRSEKAYILRLDFLL